MLANSANLTNAYAGPKVVPIVREAPALVKETESLSRSGAEGHGLAEGFLTAIDFEVAAALCLYRGWHAERKGDVYLIRTLERISEHLKAMKALEPTLNPSEVGDRFA